MGLNDTLEQLEAAREECIRLERENADLRVKLEAAEVARAPRAEIREEARAEAERRWANSSNVWHKTRTHGFVQGAVWADARKVPSLAESYAGAVELLLDELGVTDEYLPPDIEACGCEAEHGIRHLIWHLSERARKVEVTEDVARVLRLTPGWAAHSVAEDLLARFEITERKAQ